MAINNPGANCMYEGVHTQFANNICQGIDVFSGGIVPGGNFYVTEDASGFYVTEDGLNNYVTES